MTAHLAIPRRRGRTREIVLDGPPVAAHTHVILGWQGGRAVTLNLAAAGPEYVTELLNAVLDARSALAGLPEVNR